jgi:hypothetical protein
MKLAVPIGIRNQGSARRALPSSYRRVSAFIGV